MKDLILIFISIVLFAVAAYAFGSLFPRNWFDIPDCGPNVGEEE